MSDLSEADSLLIERIRSGDPDAWNELISRYEGRLLAFVESRVRNRANSEDVVQETFVGFLTSLPNYDGARALEGYLFSICAHKLTDFLRRQGRRPAISFSGESSADPWAIEGSARPASSIVRSVERRKIEEQAIAEAIGDQIANWQSQGNWVKLKCLELLIVRGWANKNVAAELEISEQQVANFKADFLSRLRALIKKQGLSEDLFPELYEE